MSPGRPKTNPPPGQDSKSGPGTGRTFTRKRPTIFDLYEVLSWPKSRSGRALNTVAEIFGLDIRKLKRDLQKNHHRLDFNFWFEKGRLSDRDWQYFQETDTRNQAIYGKFVPVGPLPPRYRRCQPFLLLFIIFLQQVRHQLTRDRTLTPPLFNKAAKFLTSRVLVLSKIILTLAQKDSRRYQAAVSRLQSSLPLPFNQKKIWREMTASSPIQKTFHAYIQNLVLLALLALDIAYLTWMLTIPYTRGTSALIECFRQLSKNKNINFLEQFYQAVKSAILKKYPAQANKNSDAALFRLLHKADTMVSPRGFKRQAREIKAGKFPSPSILTEFSKSCFILLTDNKTPAPEDLDRFRQGFALYALVDLIKDLYAIPTKKTSYKTFLTQLTGYQAWLCQEVFICPLPDPME